jgi:hypothetical protein
MPKLMTEKALAANRLNAKKAGRKPGKIGKKMIAARKVLRETLVERCRRNAQKAGRPPGKLPPEIVAARKVIRMTLQERCRKNEEKNIQELERIALSPSDST